MSGRRVAWLLAAGIVVIAFAMWLASRRHLERDTRTGDLVLPGLTQSVNAVTQVELRRGDGTHATVKHERATWRVDERGWPADVGKVRKLLLDLGALNVVEEKTRLPANYPQLGVEDVSSPKASGTRIDVTSPARTWSLIVGKSSSAKSGYVRVADAPQSLLAAPLLSVDADPKSWLDHTLLDIGRDRVQQVEERPADSPSFSAARAKKEDSNFSVSPLPKGRELTSPGAAEPIVGSLAQLDLDDAHKAGADAAADSAAGPTAGSTASSPAKLSHAVFRTFDGLELEVTGHKDGTRSLVAVSARAAAPAAAKEADALNARLAGWEFDIPDYKYTAIFTPLEDLLKKPPAPPPKKQSASKAAKPRKPGTTGAGATAPAGAAAGASRSGASPQTR